jgi:ABC-type multidrug transport system fused ATPase/permease subunit
LKTTKPRYIKEETTETMAVVDLENGQDDYVPKDDNRSDTSDESEIVGKKGLHLRWSRLVKSVEIREQNSGLLRGSISTPSHQSHEDFKKSGTQTKTILNEVSGTASPGEVLALMGPSGSGKVRIFVDNW